MYFQFSFDQSGRYHVLVLLPLASNLSRYLSGKSNDCKNSGVCALIILPMKESGGGTGGTIVKSKLSTSLGGAGFVFFLRLGNEEARAGGLISKPAAIS